MKQAVVVGQDHTDKCLIAKFDGTNWAVDTSFPSITGRLRGVYSYSRNDFWVCGGTGPTGTTAPILYHFNGSWTDHSGDISDAIVFYRIDGNSQNNIWVTGQASGVIGGGAWNWNGSVWTSAKVNTIDIGYANGMSVSSEGHCYQVNNAGYAGSGTQIFSNVTDPGFASVAVFGTDDVCALHDNVIYATRGSGIRISKYTNSWSNVETGQGCQIVRAYDENHYSYVENISPGGTAYKKGNVAISSASTILSTIGLHGGGCYLDDADDIWYCTSKWGAGQWSSVPQLTHYEGGITWSGATDYNVNNLNAFAWYDISGYQFDIPTPTPETIPEVFTSPQAEFGYLKKYDFKKNEIGNRKYNTNPTRETSETIERKTNRKVFTPEDFRETNDITERKTNRKIFTAESFRETNSTIERKTNSRVFTEPFQEHVQYFPTRSPNIGKDFGTGASSHKKSNNEPFGSGGISPRLPLILSSQYGAYGLLKTYADMIKQNFKNILLTIPGERIMDPLFGVGLARFLFENSDEETFLEIEGKIKEQISKYLSIVEVINVFFSSREHNLLIKVEYKIIPLNYEDFIKIIAPINTL